MTERVAARKVPNSSYRPWGSFGHDVQQDWQYVRRLLIALAVVGLAYFVWLVSDVLLLIFAATLLAVLLSAFADLIARHTPVPQRWALTTATAIVALLLSAFLVLFGAQIGGQVSQLNIAPAGPFGGAIWSDVIPSSANAGAAGGCQ